MARDLKEVENLTRGKAELENLGLQKTTLLGELENLLKQFDKENARFKELMAQKGKYIRDRDKVATERTEDAINAIVRAREKLKTTLEAITGWIDTSIARGGEILDKTIATASKAQEIVEAVGTLETTWQTALRTIQIQTSQSEKLLIKNSETEKLLLKRQKEVEQKSRDAEAKLEKAKEIAFWHKQKDIKIQT
jgi:hypothetical protein